MWLRRRRRARGGENRRMRRLPDLVFAQGKVGENEFATHFKGKGSFFR